MLATFREIGRIFLASYQDSIRLVTHMWRAILIVVPLLVAARLAAGFVSDQIGSPLGKALTVTLGSIAGSWLAAPYFVALYRFVLVGETVRWPESQRRSRIASLFFGWSAVLAFLLSAPVLLHSLLGISSVGQHPVMGLAFAIAWFAVLLYMVRLTTLLPAAAMGETTSLPQAFEESRGHFWFIVVSLFLTALPMTLLVRVAFDVANVVSGSSGVSVIQLAVVFAAGCFAWLLGIAATSHIYLRFGRPPHGTVA